jgi:hypothetical protein
MDYWPLARNGDFLSQSIGGAGGPFFSCIGQAKVEAHSSLRRVMAPVLCRKQNIRRQPAAQGRMSTTPTERSALSYPGRS